MVKVILVNVGNTGSRKGLLSERTEPLHGRYLYKKRAHVAIIKWQLQSLPGDKPLLGPMMTQFIDTGTVRRSLWTQFCVSRDLFADLNAGEATVRTFFPR